MALIQDKDNASIALKVDSIGSLWASLKDRLGGSITRRQRETINTSPEGLLVMGKNDDYATFLRTDRKGSLMTGNFQPEISEMFEGAIVNLQKWVQSLLGFTAIQATLTGYTLTNNANLASGSFSMITSVRFIANFLRQPIQVRLRKRIGALSNTTFDFGIGAPIAVAVPVNGVVFRVVNGIVYGSIYANSILIVDNTLKALVTDGVNTIGNDFSLLGLTTSFYTYDLICDDDNAVFTIQDTGNGNMMAQLSVNVPAGTYKMFSSTSLPVFDRVQNTAIVTTPGAVSILSGIQVMVLDANWMRDIYNIAGSLGLGASRNSLTGVQTENNVNSVAPVTGLLSNTVPAYTTLGGKFQFSAPLGAETDYALFAFQVPATTRLGVKGVRIDIYNMGAISATTPTLIEFFLVSGLTASSLLTANQVRESLGAISIPVGTVVGQYVGFVETDLEIPEYTESSRFVVLGMRIPVGTATASQLIRGTVNVKGLNY